jgi:hypothetical protein
MVAPLGGGDGYPGAPSINAKNVDGGPPWEVVLEDWERPPSTQETLMVGPLGGGDRDPRAPTINARNYEGEPPWMRCWISGSTHHQRKKCQWWAP